MNKRRSLGRGLDVLLSPKSTASRETDESPVQLPLSGLQPGRFQPRTDTKATSIDDLAASMKSQGVVQPIIVRPLRDSDGSPEQYEIVAGERRWRAAQQAGLTSIPAIQRELDDQSALVIGLIENLQREDLNPIEESTALARLADEFDLTHEQVADAVGRSRSAVSNLLRLQELHDGVKSALAEGKIDMGHARALLSLDVNDQVALVDEIVAKGMTVRQVERVVRRRTSGDQTASTATEPIDMQTRWLQKALSEEAEHAVEIRALKSGRHKLAIEFADLKSLIDALQRIQALVEGIDETAGPRVRESK